MILTLIPSRRGVDLFARHKVRGMLLIQSIGPA